MDSVNRIPSCPSGTRQRHPPWARRSPGQFQWSLATRRVTHHHLTERGTPHELTINEVTDLALGVIRSLGYEDDAIVDHLMDCELRGLAYGGLARALTLHERLTSTGRTADNPQVVHETAMSARIDGADEVGYLVASKATEMAIEKARAHGLSIVGAANTWCSGMSSYYLERVAAKGLIGIAIASGGPLVAPYGSTEAKLGTNPVAVVFPTNDGPIIWDIGTSAIMLAEATLATRTGQQIEPGLAYAPDGSPTQHPSAALKGAFAVWGGHKGSGLAVMTQMLGFLAGATVEPGYLTDHAYLIIAIDPAILGDAEAVLDNASEFVDRIRKARPLHEGSPVKLPFDGSRERRQTSLDRGWIEVDEVIVEQARAIAAG